MKKPFIQCLLISLLMLTGMTAADVVLAAADPDTTKPDLKTLNRNAEQLKQQAVDFNRELLLLEDDAVPAQQRVTVFISQSRELPLTPDAVEIQIDPDVGVQKHYSAAEGAALRDGGSQRLYLGALAPGRHVLSASLSATDSTGNTHSYSSKLSFRAGQGSRTLDIQLDGRSLAEANLLIHESN